MNMTLVKYRTNNRPYNQHAVVPEIWLSDLLQWIMLSEAAEIVSTTDNVDGPCLVPINWPSYGACQRFVCVSDLFVHGR